MLRRRPPSAEKLQKRQEKQRTQIIRRVRTAGVAETETVGDGTPTTESVLVFKGRHEVLGNKHDGNLEVFDREATALGEAVAVNGGCELRDNGGRCLLVVERHWEWGGGTFAVKRPTGEEISLIGRPRLKLSHTVRPVTAHGFSLGCLKLGWEFTERASLEDPAGNEVVKIRRVLRTYVAAISPSATEPLKTVAVAASIVWDLTTLDSSGGA